MAYITKQNGLHKEYICKDVDSLGNIILKDVAPGSTAYIPTTKESFILNVDKAWYNRKTGEEFVHPNNTIMIKLYCNVDLDGINYILDGEEYHDLSDNNNVILWNKKKNKKLYIKDNPDVYYMQASINNDWNLILTNERNESDPEKWGLIKSTRTNEYWTIADYCLKENVNNINIYIDYYDGAPE